MIDPKVVGNNIKNIRLSKQWSMADLARYLKMSRSAVNNWEKGNNLPSPDNINKLAKLGGISTDQLLGNSTKENRNKKEIQISDKKKIEVKKIIKTYQEKIDKANDQIDELLDSITTAEDMSNLSNPLFLLQNEIDEYKKLLELLKSKFPYLF